MDEFELWANFKFISKTNGNFVKNAPGRQLEAKDEESAIKEAKILTEQLNEEQRRIKSDLRYVLYHVVKTIKKMYLEDKSFWLDKQSFKEVYPKEKYPENK